MTFVSIFSSQL